MENMFVKLNVAAIRNGIAAKLGARNFLVITSIAAHMDEEGRAFPSQDKIAQMTGYSRQTISRTIRELKATEIDGEPVLTVTQRKIPNGVSNSYRLSNKVGFSFGKDVSNSTKACNISDIGMYQNEQGDVKRGLQEEELRTRTKELELKEKEVQEKEMVFDTAKDVVQYYQQKYFDKYGVAYNPNWGRDAKLIKSKLLSKFTSEEIKTMIDVAFRDYDKRWKTKKYTRPSIGQISSWLGNKALAIAAEEAKQKSDTKEASKRYEYDESTWDKIDDLI